MSTAIADAVRDGRLPGRVWLYSNYHCNLVCTYCLTDSSPKSPRRDLAAARMVDLAAQARDLGFTDLGVTGGEPFLRPDMVDVLLAMAEQLPTVVLSNATLFHGDRLTRVEALAGHPVVIQVSLDYADADDNDAQRGDDNHATVVAAISRLCALHRSLGVADEDHVVRQAPAAPDREDHQRPRPPQLRAVRLGPHPRRADRRPATRARPAPPHRRPHRS